MRELQPQKRRGERKHREDPNSHTRSVIYLHFKVCDGKEIAATKSAEGAETQKERIIRY